MLLLRARVTAPIFYDSEQGLGTAARNTCPDNVSRLPYKTVFCRKKHGSDEEGSERGQEQRTTVGRVIRLKANANAKTRPASSSYSKEAMLSPFGFSPTSTGDVAVGGLGVNSRAVDVELHMQHSLCHRGVV
jgi:hypothetical protein